MWKDYLNEAERAELDRAQVQYDAAKGVYRDILKRLMNRAKQRMRRDKGKDDESH